MLKGKKKALAAQVLLGLMVAGNAYAATDITVTGEGTAQGSWGTMTTENENKILCGDWTFITSKPEGNANNNFGPILGGGLLLPGEGQDIDDYNITVNAAIAGNNFTLIKGKNVTNNVITLGEGWPRKIDIWGPKVISNVFSGSESSSGNKFRLGILENPNGVEAVNIGDENDIELLGGKANTAGEGAPPNWVTADYSGISFSGRNLTLSDADGTEQIKSANMQGTVTATRALNVTEDLIASGDITANGGLTAGGDIKGANISTASQALKGNVIAANGDITSGTLDANKVYAKNITASGNINVTGVIKLINDNAKARAVAGNIKGSSITAGSIIAHDVTATSGDIVADSINASGDVIAASGNVTLNSGASNITGTLNSNSLNLKGDSSLTVGTLQTNNICIDSTAEGTVLTAGNITNANGDSAKLDDVFTPTQSTTSTALFDTTYGTYVEGSAIKNGLVKSEVREQSKSYVETQMATLAMVASGADLLANAGFTNAAQAVQDAKDSGDSGRSMVPYAAANYGSMRQESGSHVDVKGSNFNIGFAKEVKNGSGKLLFGPMFEYGRGNYDSYLDDGTTGSGTAQNYGIGMMARQTNDNGFYYEGSVRYGKVTSDYSSSNVLAGKDVSYDNSAKYWGAHVGVGKLQKLGGDNAIDLYGKLFYTNQGSSSVNIDGDTLDFSSVKSKRSRIGFRYIHGTSKVRSVYAGLAWQYEFDGSAYATANGFSTPSPSVKGSSGMLELGVLIAPKASPVSFDLGVSGWAGKQKGYSLNANMCWSF